MQEYVKTFSDNAPEFVQTGKNLMAVPCGEHGKKYLKKIIEHFGNNHFDYMVFVYDAAEFKEKIFEKCTVIHEKGVLWYFAKKYLDPNTCKSYDYIFFWDDDIDVLDFDVEKFLEIMRRNELSVAQPALLSKKSASHTITVKNPSYHIGRFTDFVEIMVPVFRRDAWEKFWEMLETEWNFWGWGYDVMFKSIKGIKKMGIIDAQAVSHTRPITSSQNPLVREEMKKFRLQYKQYNSAKKINLRALK